MNYSRELLPTILNRYHTHTTASQFASKYTPKTLQLNNTLYSNSKFTIKNLSKQPIDYDSENNHSDSQSHLCPFYPQKQSKYYPNDKTQSHIKRIRRNKSQQLIQRAKNTNNKHFFFKLKTRRSSTKLQNPSPSILNSYKQNSSTLFTRTHYTNSTSTIETSSQLHQYKKYKSFRSQWFSQMHQQ